MHHTLLMSKHIHRSIFSTTSINQSIYISPSECIQALTFQLLCAAGDIISPRFDGISRIPYSKIKWDGRTIARTAVIHRVVCVCV